MVPVAGLAVAWGRAGSAGPARRGRSRAFPDRAACPPRKWRAARSNGARRCRYGEDAWHRGDTEDFDAVILVLGLPTLDGLTVLKEWRKAGRPTWVLILSARSQWEERVEGIEVGADDYVVKPFAWRRSSAPIRALIRHAAR